MNRHRESTFTLLISVRVKVYQNDDDMGTVLPTPAEVAAAYRTYTGGELISYKALAESEDLPALLETEITEITHGDAS